MPFNAGCGTVALARTFADAARKHLPQRIVVNNLATGKLEMLALMADQRLKSFDKIPTLKERGIDVSIGAWRGPGVARNTPKEVVDVLEVATVAESQMREAMDKLSLGYAYGDDASCRATMQKDNENFEALVPKLGLSP